MNHVSYIKSAAVRRRAILGLEVSCFSYGEALSFASQMASLPIGQTTISFLNANNANIMYSDQEYRSVLSRQMIFPDGIGVDLAACMVYGDKFPANLNGTDFVPALLTYMDRPKRIGLIGGRPGVAQQAAENFKRHAPWHEFIAVSDGFFDNAKSDVLADGLADLSLDVLLVGLGSPRQEKWVDANIRPEHARLVICVGALFDFIAHVVPRAPRLVRQLRLEWLFRLAVEPRRLWRRYVVGNPLFLARCIRQAFAVRVLGKSFPGGPQFGISR